MKYIILSFLIAVSTFLFSQDKENSNDSILVLIHKCRNSVIDNFNKNKITEVQTVTQLLLSYESEEYVALFPFERWVIDYYLQNYKDVLLTIIEFDTAYVNSYRFKKFPSNDSLSILLNKYLELNNSNLLAKIEFLDISPEKKEIFKINLKSIQPNKQQPVIYQDSLNEYVNTFIEKNPESIYIPYLKNNVFREYIPSKIAWSLDFGLGIGKYNKSLSNSFGQNGLADIGTEISFNKLNFILRYKGGSATVGEDFIVQNTTWQSNAGLSVSAFEFSLGYNIFDFNHLKLSPFTGISKFNLTPIEEEIKNNEVLKNTKLKFAAYTLGLTFDLKYRLHRFDSYYGRLNNNFGLIRLRYEFNLPFDDLKSDIGYIHYITIGWGFSLKGLKIK